MKVLFDHQIFCFQYGGASKYFAMLINSLPPDSWTTSSLFSVNEYVREKGLFKTFQKRFRGQNFLSDYFNRPYTNYLLRKGDYDVFHQTNFGTYCLKTLGSKPMVTTYHDANLSSIDPHPEIVSKQKVSLERADAVICVSQNTKKDMLELFNVDDSKVHVIYHGIELPNIEKINHQPLFGFPYILFVGRRSAYKNFVRLSQAFAIVHEKFPDIHLVCSSLPFSNEELKMFQELGITEYVHYICANEQDMLRLYRDALFFIYPSLYEGFGMPILESWACGCPTIVSNSSCFPEIAANAALYFNPLDVDEMVDRMINVVVDESLRYDLIRKGHERVRLFSWEKTAKAHMNIYDMLV